VIKLVGRMNGGLCSVMFHYLAKIQVMGFSQTMACALSESFTCMMIS